MRRPFRRAPQARVVIFVRALIFMIAGARPALSAEAPRETALAPAEERATFRLADSRLTVELVASEPQLDSPVAISWDADGRMYVAEMIDYPQGPTAGRIRLLEDADHDGRYERATVFAAGLSFPNGVLAAQGGVFVTASPDILFLADTDGDRAADQRRVVFTGFAEGNQQLRANGLTWGLDNWVYGANGRSDGNVRRPDDPPERAVSIRARDFRFRPDGSRFEATSGPSQFGQAGDDWGNRFLSWNTIPVRQALFEQSFMDRNPRLSAFGVRDIADPADTGQVFPISPRPQTFNRERTDFSNALCGLTIYRGDRLGEDYAGNAFAGESLTNLVHRRVLAPAGPTFVSRRGEQACEFLASSDPWFHPVYMTTGPDGALYIVDFYRRWVEHPAFVAESLRPKVDWRQGSGHGRIWRVARRDLDASRPPAPRLTGAPTKDLVAQLESPNGWRRDTAQRLLVERRDPAAAPLLAALVARGPLAQTKLHALSILEALTQLDEASLLAALKDEDPHVCQHALRLAAPRLAESSALRASAAACSALADSGNALVHFQLALALASVEGPEKTAALVKLADRDAADPLVPLAIAGSLQRSIGDFLVRLFDDYPQWRSAPTAPQIRLLTEVAAIACGTDDRAQLDACLALIAPPVPSTTGPGDMAVLAGMAQGVADRGLSLRAMIAQQTPDAKQGKLPSLEILLSAARALAKADDRPLDHRLVAIEVLGAVDPSAGEVLLSLIEPRHAQPLQSAAAGALAGADAGTAQTMFASWHGLTITTRRALVSATLRCCRPPARPRHWSTR